MANFQEIKEYLNKKTTGLSEKADKARKAPGIGWEVAAYSVRGVSVAAPAVTIMCLENSWLKTGIGLFATLMIIALFIIYKKPIQKAMSYAPGVIPFSIFVAIAIFFNTVSNALLTIGISGLAGSVVAVPLHLKYTSLQETEKTPEQQSLERIASVLENLK